MNIQNVFQRMVGLGASWVLWVLVALSVLALAVILERIVFFLSTRQTGPALALHIARSLSREQLPAIRRELDLLPSLEARIVGAALLADCPEEAEERITAESQLQRLRAEKNLAFLGTLGNNAPFVGLLGTVIGIIGAFHQLEVSEGQLTAGLMAEIGEALVATAAGLLVALPAVASFNSFQRAIAVRLARGDACGRQVIAHLHLARSKRHDALALSGGVAHARVG